MQIKEITYVGAFDPKIFIVTNFDNHVGQVEGEFIGYDYKEDAHTYDPDGYLYYVDRSKIREDLQEKIKKYREIRWLT